MLDITFLGTSSGVPTRQRNVSALAVRAPLAGAGWYLLDCGEGTQQQLLRTGLSLHSLAAVCISHVHGDHCYGLPGLLASAGMGARQRPLRLIAPPPVWQWLQATQQCTDLHLPYAIEFIDLSTLRGQSLELCAAGQARLMLSAHPQAHRAPSHAFRFELVQRQIRLNTAALQAAGLPPGPAWRALQHGQDVTHQGRQLRSADFAHAHTRRLAAVLGGDNARPDALRAACEGAQLLVHEATYSRAALQKAGPGPMHSCAHDVAAFAQCAGVPNLILTHFSPRHHSEAGQDLLMQEARAQYAGQLHLARDFDVYALDFDGQLRMQPPAASTS
ncbi:MBL fold metallo-hydrolase [Vandammella animalimorsus]|uniref:Ribonuclease Z n=1 Tax=Vandammella animalimorsus TaxID=2029117 RepID=A0A2A2ASN7_9BURK|nr:ribonuclease Z [Vandammella animalimorsus]PAT40704.1 MBL fold metallo-hydrolase [Vandammella animalimorsus]